MVTHPGARSAQRLGVGGALVDGRIVAGDMEVRPEGVVTAVGLSQAGRGLAIPGLIDLQVNGYAGIDVGAADVDGMHHLARALAADGVLAYGPTIMTSPDDEVVRGLRTVGAAQQSTPVDAARIIRRPCGGPLPLPTPSRHPPA